MRVIRRAVLAAATLFATACASDGTTSPTNTSGQFETRLSAAATPPTVSITSPTLTLNVEVTNTLSETVSGSICATTVLARTVSGTSWTNVTSATASCPQSAAIVAAGATVTFRGIADPAKVRAVAGGNTGTVVFKVQHTLSGNSTNYNLQSNEVTWTMN